ncbi:hypothetical protein IE077_003766 [Cardiosporidium cionae]|uniref:RecQ-mediated genome instability protein 1 n=1 Tax=Cardiosporidium cionae TaxID=476202 RepID=A0ABQ7J7J4_9APIC|nr:hypothetical protein IE077_003766 [Cardiosporidium cionae]|eukprot:KAF8819949.1 hypothetical protein IE077_003766 [Cardiosporidium cionae]
MKSTEVLSVSIKRDLIQQWCKTEWGIELSKSILEVYQEFADWSSECLKRSVMQELLEADLRKIVSSTAPEFSIANRLDGPANSKQTLLRGPILAQILDIIDIGKPRKSSTFHEVEDEFAAPEQNFSDVKKVQMLLFRINDGRQTCKAIEYQKCPVLNIEILPGTKIILSKKTPLEVRNGIILLQPEGVELLGGRISRLVEAKEAKQNVNRQLYQQAIAVDKNGLSGPPKFEPFPVEGCSSERQPDFLPHIDRPEKREDSHTKSQHRHAHPKHYHAQPKHYRKPK